MCECVCFSVTRRSGRVCFHNLSDGRQPPHLAAALFHTYVFSLPFFRRSRVETVET